MLTSGVQSSAAAGSGILGLLGINLQDVTGMIGLQCSPLSVIGLGGGSACSQQPVCCQNNNVVSVIYSCSRVEERLTTLMKGGLISIGCIPIQL